MEELKRLLHAGNYSCVIRNTSGIRTCTQRGVADLFDLYTQSPEVLAGASIADKVIGKGAAALMVLGGVQEVYADVISTPALLLLRKAEIAISYSREVPYIINRTKTGSCPLEAACKHSDQAEELFPVIQDFIRKLSNQSNENPDIYTRK